jgi:hypothetical protein
VPALILHGGSLYVGGQFTSVDGSTRNRLAAGVYFTRLRAGASTLTRRIVVVP